MTLSFLLLFASIFLDHFGYNPFQTAPLFGAAFSHYFLRGWYWNSIG